MSIYIIISSFISPIINILNFFNKKDNIKPFLIITESFGAYINQQPAIKIFIQNESALCFIENIYYNKKKIKVYQTGLFPITLQSNKVLEISIQLIDRVKAHNQIKYKINLIIKDKLNRMYIQEINGNGIFQKITSPKRIYFTSSFLKKNN